MKIIRYTDNNDKILQHFDNEIIIDPCTLPDAIENINFLNAADCSDWVRLYFMMTDNDVLWIDNDCVQIAPYVFSGGMPHCANMIGEPDIWVCYSGNCYFWQEYFERLLKMYPLRINAGNVICAWLRGNRNEIKLISNGHFIHKPKLSEIEKLFNNA